VFPLAKNIKRLFSLKKQLLVVSIAAIVLIGAGIGVFAWVEKDVVINDNGNVITCKTMKNTFELTLEENGIVVNEHDYISVPLDTSLQTTNINEIYIKRAVPVYITADNTRTELMTYKNTVKELLSDSPLKPEGNDRLEGANPNDVISEGMEIKIVRVTEKVVGETETIPYVVHRRTNKRMDEGSERIIQQGQDGVLEKLYKVVIEDGKEVSRLFFSEKVLLEPVNMVMELGTVLNHTTSRGDVVRYSKVMDMKATSYTASFKDTGKAPGHPLFGICATGMKARKGVIAVDPKVIPLHTRLYVEIIGDTPDYGYCIAGDVGGAIKGNKIDLYYDTQEYVDKFGVKKVRVYILNEEVYGSDFEAITDSEEETDSKM
jgi:uncharacterized protein YabE (DUF348 family)